MLSLSPTHRDAYREVAALVTLTVDLLHQHAVSDVDREAAALATSAFALMLSHRFVEMLAVDNPDYTGDLLADADVLLDELTPSIDARVDELHALPLPELLAMLGTLPAPE